MTTKEQKASQDLIIYRLDEIKAELKSIKSDYVTKHEFKTLADRLTQLEKNRNLIGWLYPTASAAFSALVTYLLIEFFKNK